MMQNPSPLIRQLLTTDLWIRMIASFFLFFLNGILWTSVFEFYFPGFEGGLISFAGASLSLIVGSVYSSFLNKMMKNYLAAPTSYTTLLVQIGFAADAIAGLYQQGLAKSNMLKLKTNLQMIAFYSYRIFAPENKDKLGSTEDRPTIDFTSTTTIPLAELASEQAVIYKINNLYEELIELSKDVDFMSPIEFIHKLRINTFKILAKIQLENKKVDIEIIRMALESLQPTWNQLEMIESGGLIKEATIFRAHTKALFIFYFFIWVPISSWASIGWIATIILYPFIAMAFLEPAIYNDWINDPFNPNRQVMIADLIGLRERYSITDFENKFKTSED